jgi:3-dehydroquinate synthase
VGAEELAATPALAPGAGEGRFWVRTETSGYEVTLAPQRPGPTEVVGALLAELGHPLVVADAAVLRHHLPGGLGSVPCLAVEATEATKSLEGVASVLEFLAEQKAGRSSVVVAMGGGVVQDVTGLACGIFKRGLPWYYVPTTLLAQADSCIGSKTGVNFRRTKNLLGLFSAPERVVSHPGFLATLPPEDLRSGLGEIFKLCVTGGASCLERLEASLPAALDGDLRVIRELAALALAVKRPVIEADERDRGVRRALNFGHSVGHAVEAATGYAVPHGTAVVLGALVECALSAERGLLARPVEERLRKVARALVTEDQVRRVEAVEPGQLFAALEGDKKVEGVVLKLAVPVDLGAIELVDLRLDAAGLVELRGALGCLSSLR